MRNLCQNSEFLFSRLMGFYQVLGLGKIFIIFQNHGEPHIERDILQQIL